MGHAPKGFGHDYHNLARQYHGFDEDDRPGEADPNYRRPDAATVAPQMNAVSTLDNTIKTTWDTNTFNPGKINPYMFHLRQN